MDRMVVLCQMPKLTLEDVRSGGNQVRVEWTVCTGTPVDAMVQQCTQLFGTSAIYAPHRYESTGSDPSPYGRLYVRTNSAAARSQVNLARAVAWACAASVRASSGCACTRTIAAAI